MPGLSRSDAYCPDGLSSENPPSDRSAGRSDAPPTATLPRSGNPAPSIGELEAKYSLYCKAMRLLLKEGRSVEAIRRTVCWSRLEQLHLCLPGRYKSPDYLYAVLKRDLA